MTASPNYVTWSRGNGTGNGCCVALAALSLRQQMAPFGLPLPLSSTHRAPEVGFIC